MSVGPDRQQTIQLRPLCDADMAIFRTWLHAPHVAPWFSDPESWLREVRARDGAFRFIRHFIACVDQQPVGFCQYYCCGDAGEPEYAAFPPDTTYSIDYLTSWAGADTQIIRDTASRVLTAAHQIIEALASNAEENTQKHAN